MTVKQSQCRYCEQYIVWCVTNNGARMPVNIESIDEDDLEFVGEVPRYDRSLGHESHFANCPAADQVRRR